MVALEPENFANPHMCQKNSIILLSLTEKAETTPCFTIVTMMSLKNLSQIRMLVLKVHGVVVVI